MKQEDYLKYSHNELKEINSLKANLRTVETTINRHIESVDNTSNLAEFHAPFGFWFIVNYPIRNANTNKVTYKIHYKPRSHSNNDDYTTHVERNLVIEGVQKWADRVAEYIHELRLAEDPFYVQAEKEIVEVFHLEPEDGDDSATYSLKDQAKIRLLLTYLEDELKKENPNGTATKTVLETTKEIQDSIGNIPKSKAKRLLNKAFVLTKKAGSKAFDKLIDELLKRGVNFALDKGQDLIEGYLLSLGS